MRRALAVALLVALAAAPAATGKFRMWLVLGDSSPRVGQPITVVLRSGQRLPYDLRVIAVAPGRNWYDVVGTITGDSVLAEATIPRDGFEVKLTRMAPDRWRAFVRFPRAGRWHLVVPNGAPTGFTSPPPVMRPVMVRRR